MVKTILFDWDGTLHNTAKIYHEAVKKAYAYLVSTGYATLREITETETSKYLGMTAKEMWDDFMPDLPSEIQKTAEQMIADEMIFAIERGEAMLYPGTIESLTSLRKLGYNVIVLSNCKEAYMDAHRKYFSLDQFFDEYACAESYGYISKSEIFRLLKEKYEGNYLMVGDRESDISVGENEGVYTLGCTYGFGNEQELSKADRTINCISEILDAINKLD